MEQRLVDLEVRYTHLERLVEELDRVVFAQQQVIDGLVKQVKALTGRLSDLGEPMEPAEKPPHY